MIMYICPDGCFWFQNEWGLVSYLIAMSSSLVFNPNLQDLIGFLLWSTYRRLLMPKHRQRLREFQPFGKSPEKAKKAKVSKQAKKGK